MTYSLLELLVLFLVYSFLGWIIETGVASLKNKRFRNRGLVNGPMCMIYGFSGVFMTVFLVELKATPFFLFLGTAITATVIEWFAGKLLELLNQERWWDYSNKKWNLNGYICLQYSVIWGILGSIAIMWLNDFFINIVSLLPGLVLAIVVWSLVIVNVLDVVASLVAIVQKQKEQSPSMLVEWDQSLDRWTTRLQHKIAGYINRRIEKAYPDLQKEKVKEDVQDKLGVGEFIWLFCIGALIGDIVETIFCRISVGYWMSRSSLVWGPFSIVWGLAIALVTALLYRDKDKSDSYLFAAGTILGGAYEYVCSVFTEIVFGTVFWDYSQIPFNLGGRINLLYCFFWGIAAVVWFKLLYPKMKRLVDICIEKTGKKIIMAITVFMIVNMLVSSMALARYDARYYGVEPENAIEELIDARFPDSRMEKIYPNAKKVKTTNEELR